MCIKEDAGGLIMRVKSGSDFRVLWEMGGVAWTEEEDHLLKKCIQQYGEGKWHRVPLLAGKTLLIPYIILAIFSFYSFNANL